MTNRQLFLSHLAQTSSAPLLLEIEKAEGVYLYDIQGRKYMDLISGISVSNLGHGHPKVINAVKEQTDKYMHTMVYGEYIQSPQTRLAARLAQTLPEQLSSVYFVNSGSEATEGAMKLAKRFTGRHKIISCINAYHGSTQGALSISGNERLKNSFRPLLPGTERIRFGMKEDLVRIDKNTAAVFIEPVQGESGVRLADQEYFNLLSKQCRRTDTLIVFDEIQSGFGRTGYFWGFEKYNVIPDILLTAKGMGGGLPLGAFISSPEIMSVLMENPVLGHITTFGGNPVSCAASLATVEVILSQNLIEEVEAKASLFRELLVHPLIKEIRNAGLMMAVEFQDFPLLKRIIDRTILKGVITDWFLFCDNSMRIAPPLTITPEEIRIACYAILQAADEISSEL